MSVKKILGFLLALSVIAMLVVTPLGVAAVGDDVEIDMGDGIVFTPGDIDGDGNVNLNDLVVIAAVEAGLGADSKDEENNEDGEA